MCFRFSALGSRAFVEDDAGDAGDGGRVMPGILAGDASVLVPGVDMLADLSSKFYCIGTVR